MVRRTRRVDAAPQRPHRVNRDIRFPEIRVIGPDGEQVGIMSPEEGRELAQSHGLDLVEVAPNTRPPVCRVMDYGKYRYEQQKKKSASRSATTTLKTIRLRPKTDDHDLQTKLKRARRFLEEGNSVRFEMRMRGRERAKPARWVNQLEALLDDFEADAQMVAPPRAEGRNITATLQPTSES